MSPPRRRYELAQPELNQKIEELLASAQSAYGETAGADYVRQVLVTALRMVRDGTSRGDLKLVNSALKELRHSFRVFRPYVHLRKVAVFGSARTSPDHGDWKQAFHFAERMVERGWMVITGAGDGVMAAAQGGAGREASFGVNIRLPFEQAPNEVIEGDPKLINFRYFFTRKVAFVKEAHAIALFPGGFGTHDEGFEALTLIQTGKSEILPVVFVDEPGGSYWRDWQAYVESHLNERGLISPEDLSLFRVTDDVDAAVEEVHGFYRNYHSSRYVGDQLVLRVRSSPNQEQLEELNRDFADLVTRGAIDVSDALESESDEVGHFPRVLLRMDRRKVGRLRQLIDRLNGLVEVPASAEDASPHEIVEGSLSPEAESAQESEE
ncbi:MAG: LOG family protein [Proteobacteria bacterium]|nr:LOG family protein [Pseudomonadota bacterium]